MRDHTDALKAGVNGLLFTAEPTSDAAGPMSLTVDYSGFKDAYGGDWSSRLHLVTLPACALVTPAKPACRVQTPLPSTNSPRTSRITAQVRRPQTATAPLAHSRTALATGSAAGQKPTTHTAPQAATVSSTMVLAATSSSSGGAGDYSATPLSPSGSWASGGNSGDFTYSYPIVVPPAPGGLTPKLALSYSAQSVDGRLASTNNQAGWVGDGWSLEPGSVSRSYMPCSDDPAGTAPKVPDDCWAGQILHVSFAGHSGDIVQDSGTATGWKLSDDDGSKVELLTASGQNDTYDGDYWKITTTDGSQYFFGRNKLPGYSGTTNSAWTVPVYGAHSGDPCYNATFANASCQQAWQWNLDEVVDTHGNAMAYYYAKETNYYGADNGTTGVSYTRGGYLDHIGYGLGNGSTTAPQRIAFTVGDRCTATTCNPIASNTANWPDVPYDLNCNSGASCSTHAPSFWSEKRLTTITTSVYNTSTAKYTAVDTYTLAQSFPDPGDNTKPALWLNSITHTGNNGTALSLPAVTFTGIKLANRYNTGNGYPDLVRYRIGGITTESGDAISVSYSSASCSTPSDPSTNTGRCFPVYWTPTGQPSPILDWFNKYLVNSVSDNDTTGGSTGTVTSYTYLGNPGWHYDDNEIVKAKYRTWGQWRGYPEVQARTGTTTDGQTLTDSFYYLGMDGDTLPGGKTRTATVTLSSAVTVPGTQTTVPDTNQLSGNVRETVSYKGSGGSVAGASVDDYWVSAATATRTRTGLPDLTATMVRPAATYATTAVTSGSTTTWRTTQTQKAYDKTTGLLVYTDDHGDTSVSAQERCTTTAYAPANTSANLVGLPAEVETDSGPCSTGNTATSDGLGAPSGVNRPTDVLSDARTFYDTNPTAWPPTVPAWPQPAPTTGDPTLTQKATDYTGGTFTYQAAGATAYDTWGRATNTWDALGNKTHTAFTTTSGQTTAQAATNAKNQTTTTTLDPARGLPTAAVDPNNAETDTAYDALGRTTALWLPGRSKATQSANYTFTYLVSRTAPSAVTTNKLDEQGNYTTSVTLYDALLRSRQTQTQIPNPASGRLLTDTFYDSRGWAFKTNHGYVDGSSTPSTTLVTATDPQVTNQDLITFDGLGRPVLDASKDKGAVVSQTKTVYGGDRTTVIPPTGGTPATTVTDALGRTVETDKYTATPTVTGDQVTGGSPKATVFTYDTAGSHGRLAAIKDPGGNQRTYTYNLLGQKTAQSDPDTGTTRLTYDADGQLKSTQDANATVSYDYDVLGRKTGEYDGANDTAAQLAGWTYDDPAVANGIGRLTAAIRYSGGVSGSAYIQATTGYTLTGKPTGTKITIPSTETGLAGTYTYTNTYTTNTELLYSTAYPAAGSLPAETVNYGYNTLNDLTSVGGTSTYTSDTTYDAYSRVAQMTVGKLANRTSFTDTYDEHTGALNEVNATRTTTPQAVDDTTYTRDLVGNITRTTDVQSGTTTDTQCYSYDLLGRMTRAWTATDQCAAAPTTTGSTPNVGGPNAYWTSWTFDDDGNRKQQTQHATSGATGNTTTQYNYGQTTDPTKQPDTLTSTTTTNPDNTTSSTTSAYDAAGNATTVPNGTLTWDDEGHLATLTAPGKTTPTNYLYDADGQLLIRTDPNGGKTLQLPNQEVSYHAANLTGTRYIPLPGGVTAERSGTGNTYNYVLTNDQGTGVLKLDYTAQNATFRALTPYGGSRGTQPTWPDDKGLVGGTQDPTTGLTNLGAREYDPTTGRFLSADPLLEATDPNQIGGYTYAGDNPVTHSDPTGLMTACEDTCAPREGEKIDNGGHIVHITDTNPDDSCSEGDCLPWTDYGFQPSDYGHTGTGHWPHHLYTDPGGAAAAYAAGARAAAARAAEARLAARLAELQRQAAAQQSHHSWWDSTLDFIGDAGSFLNAHRTTILGIGSIFMPELIPFAMASGMADAGSDAYNGNYVSAGLDVVGVIGGGAALKLTKTIFEGKVAEEALTSATSRTSLGLSRRAFHDSRAAAGAAVEQGTRAQRLNNLNTVIGVGATAAYEGGAYERNQGSIASWW